MLKRTLLIIAIGLTAQSAFAEFVQGHYRANGTYVQGYNRSDANGTARDNYSYQGNTNPYTGRIGTSNQLDQGDAGYQPRNQGYSTPRYESLDERYKRQQREQQQQQNQFSQPYRPAY